MAKFGEYGLLSPFQIRLWEALWKSSSTPRPIGGLKEGGKGAHAPELDHQQVPGQAMQENVLATGALTRTPLGELTAFPCIPLSCPSPKIKPPLSVR